MPAFRPEALSCFWAASCCWPVTSGTVTVAGFVGGGGGGGPGGGGGGGAVEVLPLETLSRTAERAGTRLPPCGFCATTVPFGLVDGTVKAFGVRPAPPTAAIASARDWPTVSGTVTSTRETRSVTVEPAEMRAPACGLCA